MFVCRERTVLVGAGEILSLLPSEGSVDGEAPVTFACLAAKAANCSTCEFPCAPAAIRCIVLAEEKSYVAYPKRSYNLCENVV